MIESKPELKALPSARGGYVWERYSQERQVTDKEAHMARLVSRPASLMLLLVAALLLSGCAGTPSASTSAPATDSASAPSTTVATTPTPGATTSTDSAPSLQLPEPEAGVLSLESMIAACDLVVYGKVLAELPGRWNGPNADQWTPQFPDDACIVYRSWIVQVMSTETGFSPVGDLVTVHTEGGTVPAGTVPGGQAITMTLKRAEPEIAVGDEVLLFLAQDDLRYGGTYQPVGYWLYQGAAGAFVHEGYGGFRRPAGAAGGAEETVNMDALRAAIETLEAGGTGGGSTVGDGTQGSWKKGMSLSGVADWLAQRLPGDRRVILPRQLPEGWAVADDDQSFSDLVSYGSEQNPWVQAMGDGAGAYPEPYRVVFTDGRRLVALIAYQVGDWGETPFHAVLADGRLVRVFVDEDRVIAIVPGDISLVVVGEPGTRTAVLRIAAALETVK